MFGEETVEKKGSREAKGSTCLELWAFYKREDTGEGGPGRDELVRNHHNHRSCRKGGIRGG